MKKPSIIPRSEHTLSRRNISPAALNVLYRLSRAHYQAYLVGGSVRDLLLGHQPKDFDVATNATPEEIKKLFRNCRLIGRRFRLAHVYFGDEVIEVATFRGTNEEANHLSDEGLILHDNSYGTLAQDVYRRDFTINALYYNIADFSIVDYVNGIEDLKAKKIRLIGEPEQRYREDPVRMMRGVRLMAKLGFEMDAQSKKTIKSMAALLTHVASARLFDELMKLYRCHHVARGMQLLHEYGLFSVLLPSTRASASNEQTDFLHQAMLEADKRVSEDKTLSPGYFFAVLLWRSLQHSVNQQCRKGKKLFPALKQISGQLLHGSKNIISVPKRVSGMTVEIWRLQYLLLRTQGKIVYRIRQHRYFRAAYDFLLLRARAGEPVKDLADWWTRFIEKET